MKLSISGLEQESGLRLPDPETSRPGLPRLLCLLRDLELNGNLESELQQVVQTEQACLLQDSLLNGLLDGPPLRHCLDIALENGAPGRITVLEVKCIQTRVSFNNPVWTLKFSACPPPRLSPAAGSSSLGWSPS